MYIPTRHFPHKAFSIRLCVPSEPQPLHLRRSPSRLVSYWISIIIVWYRLQKWGILYGCIPHLRLLRFCNSSAMLRFIVVGLLVATLCACRCIHFRSFCWSFASVVVLGLGPWPWTVLKDTSEVLGLGLGLEGWVLVGLNLKYFLLIFILPLCSTAWKKSFQSYYVVFLFRSPKTAHRLPD